MNSHHHGRSHKSVCRYHYFEGGNEIIVLKGRHGNGKRAFCDQIVAYPIGRRKHV